MAKGSWNKRKHIVPQAHQAMDNFKYEIAGELGLPVNNSGGEDYWGNLSSRDCGSVGGSMVRRMIAMAQQQMAGGGTMNTGTMGTTGGGYGSTTGSTTGSMGNTTGTAYTNYNNGTTVNSHNDQYQNTTNTSGAYGSNYYTNYSNGTTVSSGTDQTQMTSSTTNNGNKGSTTTSGNGSSY